MVGYWLARRALSPWNGWPSRPGKSRAGHLHERLPTGTVDDELGHLARVFNDLLSRLEQSFEQLRRFTSDASHELRTPLTSIRSVGEVGLQRGGTIEEYRDTIGSMLEEVNRLTSLVENLLTIARADAGQIPLRPSVFGAMDLAREACGLLEVLIEDKRQQVRFEGDERVSLEGDRLLLRQALVNIIHNAVKYSPAGGAIPCASCARSDDRVRFEIADDGPRNFTGARGQESSTGFIGWTRADRVNGSGAGLGLSIAQWSVQVHDGEIQLKSVAWREAVPSDLAARRQAAR